MRAQRKRREGRPSREEEVLRYLSKQTPGGVSEDTLGAAIFGKPGGAGARVAVHQLRRDLDLYFRYTAPGRGYEKRLDVATPYELKLVPNDLALDADEKFWDAHIINGAPRLLVYTEPLFFWDEENRCYVRYLDINYEGKLNLGSIENLHKQVRGKFGPRHRALRLLPCYHYQSCGETRAIGPLLRWFKEKNVRMSVTTCQDCGSNAYDSNCIILGNKRTNRFFFRIRIRVRLGTRRE